MSIHPTAIIDKEVQLGKDVQVGAFAVIKGIVTIGDRSVIKDHAILYGPISMGEGNTVHPGAVVGNISQDLKYKGEASQVIIGSNNSIRECVTIHQGTIANDGETIIGNNNLIMAYTHIAHDCILGNNIIIANSTQLAGHIVINDFAYIGGLVGIHQFVTIGQNCFVGFMSRINRDVPPFVTVEGNPARERAINVEGLKRKNFTSNQISALRKAFNIFFVQGKSMNEKLDLLKKENIIDDPLVVLLKEALASSAKGKYGRALEALRNN